MYTASLPERRWVGHPAIRAGSAEWMQMALLTVGLAGLPVSLTSHSQTDFPLSGSIEMTYGTPYLLSLGLSKSLMSLVWLAGPMSGLVTQPLVGIISDRSRLRRRRPFIIAGAVITSVALIVLGWTRELVGVFTSNEERLARWTAVCAVLSIYAIDFAINAVQGASRAIIVDTLPQQKQHLGNAWAGKMMGFGQIIGCFMGYVKLTSFLSFLGNTQLKIICVLGALSLLSSVSITCYYVQERVLIEKSTSLDSSLQVFSSLWYTLRNLPPRIKAICHITFASWIGWFPFLSYSSTWVGEIYVRSQNFSKAHLDDDKVAQIARSGSSALLIYSCVSFASSLLLPYVIVPTTQKFSRLAPYQPNLLTGWIISIFIFSAAMLTAPWVKSVYLSTLLVSICGPSWAMTIFAPFALLSLEIHRLGQDNIPLSRIPQEEPLDNSEDSDDTDTLYLRHSLDDHRPVSKFSTSASDLSGSFLGIFNIFVVSPQFVITFISSIVFAILEPGQSAELTEGTIEENGLNAIAVILGIGGCASFGAGVFGWNVRKWWFIEE
ncbi:General alpha-glucoside permease [Neolecta irregularis DAH-3]|uniref:General alpha-glucoside permease n=1 Tax=Neolecta irregularis (strain DAH-3) TaxID=1198029 RepID=A0A1U7LWB0_NEOID|nr:General alpha-glucoside permease [Neolecta irregularis DAH-3]|eukprot:OLL26965.1 General alpha-glucoside permease [Neolecta irregularis DAH-3]